MSGCWLPNSPFVPETEEDLQWKKIKENIFQFQSLIQDCMSAISSEQVYANSCQKERLFCTKTYPVVKRLRLYLRWGIWMDEWRKKRRPRLWRRRRRRRKSLPSPSILFVFVFPSDRQLYRQKTVCLPVLTHSIFCYVCSLGRTGLNHLAKQSGEEWWWK